MSHEKISDRKYGVSENLVIAPPSQAPVNDVPVPASAYARSGPEIMANPPRLDAAPPVIVTAALELNSQADAAIAKYNETRTSYAEGYMDAYSNAWAFVLGCLTEDEGRIYVRMRDAEEGGGQ